MEYDTERWIGSIFGTVCLVISIMLFVLWHEVFPSIIPIAGFILGVGSVLLIRYIGDLPFPWEWRRHPTGGGD